MSDTNRGMARRTILKTAGIGIGAGLLSGIAPVRAQDAAAAATGEIWSSEYWAQKGNTRLNLWRKRLGAPKAGEQPLPILFLVHGSSNSTRTTYDLMVPGKGEYSFMNVFARYGFDVWTMDASRFLRGFARNSSMRLTRRAISSEPVPLWV